VESCQYEKPFGELIDELPVAQRLDRAAPVTNVSCVVGIAGFEPRCFAAAEMMRARGWRAQRGLCVCYANREMEAPNSQYTDEVISRLQAIAAGTTPDLIEHDDHGLEASFGDKLLGALRDAQLDLGSEETRVVFDITVGSSRLLLEGLHALLGTDITLTLTYTEVAAYRPAFDEFRDQLEEQRVRRVDAPEFLTRGVDRVEILKSIPGRNADSRPAYLVVFPAFAFTRVSAVIDELAPSRVQWIFGIPHLIENRWRIDAQKEYHRSLMEKSHRHCYVSTSDYRETLEVLERIYQKRRENYGLFVASLGSKMQKVGQVLFHLLRPEAAAVVSVPRIWNPDRFSGESPRAVYSLELGNCRDLREKLWRTRRLRV
jgi:hypothetical protein